MAAAPEWRHDPLTGRRVLIAPARAGRPLGVGPACPFCEGHEAETPPEVCAVRTGPPDGPGWRVRVVPNRYAALEPFAASREAASGVAEVFLETPRHETRFRNLSTSQAALVLKCWRDRLRVWRADGRLAFAQVFKNEGPAAGASVEHCHSQLLGVPFVPRLVTEELAAVADEDCAFCRWIERETGGPRVVAESDGYVVLCPVAPRFPGETWVLPQAHAKNFEDAPDAEIGRLAGVLLDSLGRINRAFGDPDLNAIVKSAPFGHLGPYHWRIEVLPRIASPAGWELATGLLINTLLPERAAELLRQASGPP